MLNFVYRKSKISHDKQQKLNKALVQLVCMAKLPLEKVDKWPLRNLLFIANQDTIALVAARGSQSADVKRGKIVKGDSKAFTKNLLATFKDRFLEGYRDLAPYNCLIFLNLVFCDIYFETDKIKEKLFDDL